MFHKWPASNEIPRRPQHRESLTLHMLPGRSRDSEAGRAQQSVKYGGLGARVQEESVDWTRPFPVEQPRRYFNPNSDVIKFHKFREHVMNGVKT